MAAHGVLGEQGPAFAALDVWFVQSSPRRSFRLLWEEATFEVDTCHMPIS